MRKLGKYRLFQRFIGRVLRSLSVSLSAIAAWGSLGYVPPTMGNLLLSLQSAVGLVLTHPVLTHPI